MCIHTKSFMADVGLISISVTDHLHLFQCIPDFNISKQCLRFISLLKIVSFSTQNYELLSNKMLKLSVKYQNLFAFRGFLTMVSTGQLPESPKKTVLQSPRKRTRTNPPHPLDLSANDQLSCHSIVKRRRTARRALFGRADEKDTDRWLQG